MLTDAIAIGRFDLLSEYKFSENFLRAAERHQYHQRALLRMPSIAMRRRSPLCAPGRAGYLTLNWKF
jgi:hypothetical protein